MAVTPIRRRAAAPFATVMLPAPAPEPFALRLIENPAAAGFPSPAGDYIESTLDLNDYLIQNKPATFLIRIAGNSLEGLGILDGDVGVVDRSVTPRDGQVVIASVDGEIVCKVLEQRHGKAALVSRNDQQHYAPIELDQVQDCTVWGVVTGLVRRL